MVQRNKKALTKFIYHESKEEKEKIIDKQKYEVPYKMLMKSG